MQSCPGAGGGRLLGSHHLFHDRVPSVRETELIGISEGKLIGPVALCGRRVAEEQTNQQGTKGGEQPASSFVVQGAVQYLQRPLLLLCHP